MRFPVFCLYLRAYPPEIMTPFHTLSLTDLIAGIRAKQFTSTEVCTHFHERIQRLDGDIQAFNLVHDTPATQDETSPLAGLPIGVKDLFCEVGVPTTASSKMLANFTPSYESTITARLKKQGVISLGKLNLDEFAMGGSGANSATRITRNPWALDRIPGGSSS